MRELIVRGKKCWVLHTFDYEDIVEHMLALEHRRGALVIYVTTKETN